MKKLLTAFISILVLTGLATQASDLVIESKNQTYNEAENKIKFNGNVKVSVDDLKALMDFEWIVDNPQYKFKYHKRPKLRHRNFLRQTLCF